jgi:cytochrome d ubiquinol oxidase subunit II
VAAIIAGWALAQNPVFLRGLTIREAAASHDTLVAIVVAVLAGAVLLFPSLALLFRLTLHGELDHGGETIAARPQALREGAGGARLAAAFLVAGVGFLTAADAPWAHAIGVVCFFGFAVAGFRRVAEVD